MKLSEDTIAVLKNFATINPNLVVKPGQKLKTIAESKTIMAEADIVEDFPNEFGIYDLNEFLSVLSLIPDADLEFFDNHIIIKNEQQKVTYYYSNPEILTTPSKAITMPNAEVGMNLSAEDLKKINQSAGVLGHSDLSYVQDDHTYAKVFDSKDVTANQYTLDLTTQADVKVPNKFNFDFNIANLKLLPGDYYVSLSSSKISNWTNSNYPVEYFIALENTTEFHV
jgi:hypothetical protein